LTFLRDGDSINFQKASCTLDGCVKIYSSRVDSVAEQTEKLLTGLAPGQVQSSSSGADAEQAEGKEAEEDTVKTRRSRKRATDSFLEKNPDTLILRTFDQESTPDPLFKKMTQQFDELQGTVGLLQTLLPMECETLSLVLDPAMPLRNIYYATARSDHNDVSDLTLNAKTALGKYAHH
jgi:condensin complex subunit 2